MDEKVKEYVIRLIAVPVLFSELASVLCFVLVLTTLRSTVKMRLRIKSQTSSSLYRSVLMTSKPG